MISNAPPPAASPMVWPTRRRDGEPPVGLQWGVALLVVAAILLAQWFHGGVMRPVFALPSLALLWLGALLSVRWLVAPGPTRWGVFLLLAWVGWSVARSPDAWLGAAALRLACGGALVFLLVANVVVASGPRLGLVSLLIAAALWQAWIGLGQIEGRIESIPGPWYSEQLRLWYEKGDTTRAHGTFLNANHLAWFLNGSGLLALGLALLGRFGWFWRGLYLLSAAALFAASLFTLSRGAWLALGAGGVALLISALALLSIARGHRRIWLIFPVALLLPLSVIPWAVGQHEAIEQRAGRLWDDPYRWAVWEVAYRQVQAHPWSGAGPGTFTYYARFWRSGEGDVEDYHVHNDWLQTAAEYGLPAVILLLGWLGLVLRAGWGRCREQVRRFLPGAPSGSQRAALAFGAFLATLALSVHAVFDFNLQLPANLLFAAAITGLLAPPIRRRPGPFTALAGSLACLALAFLFWNGRSEWYWLQAENALLKEDRPTALRLAREGADLFPSHPRLHRLVGELLAAQAQAAQSLPMLREAERAFRRAITLSPLDRGHYLRLAEALLAQQLEAEALVVAQRAMALAPDQAQAYELSGQIYEAMEQYDEAIAMYEASLQRPNGTYGRKRLDALKKDLLSRRVGTE